MLRTVLITLLLVSVSQAGHELRFTPTVKYDYKNRMRDIVNGDELFGPWHIEEEINTGFVDFEGNLPCDQIISRSGMVIIDKKDAEYVMCQKTFKRYCVWGKVIMFERFIVHKSNGVVYEVCELVRYIELTKNSKVIMADERKNPYSAVAKYIETDLAHD